MFTFINDRIIQPDGVLESWCLTVADGKITRLYMDDGKREGKIIDALGNYISPGFIDIHVHGGGEGDFMDRDMQSIKRIIKRIIDVHTAHGTTGIYPTTLTCPEEEMYQAIDVITDFKNLGLNGAEILGIHLEGPYLNIAQKGAQDSRYIKVPKKEEYGRLLGYSRLIKRVTFAPELEGGMELGRELKERGIVASIGHSEAEYEDVVKAFEIGVRHVTHLYSGMQGVHRKKGFRKLGIVECAYLLDEMTMEIIADGCHLPIELLKLIYKIKGAEKTALVTDAMRAVGRTERESVLGSMENGQRVILKDGVAYMPDFECFAGSIATMDRLVRNMYRGAGVEIYNAVKMATETPARIMGCSDRKGSLKAGKDADIIIFDDDINIKFIMTRGEEFSNAL